MKAPQRWVLGVLLLTAAAVARPALAHDLSGRWELDLLGEDGEVVLELEHRKALFTGAGVVAGTVSVTSGSAEEPAPLPLSVSGRSWSNGDFELQLRDGAGGGRPSYVIFGRGYRTAVSGMLVGRSGDVRYEGRLANPDPRGRVAAP